MKNRKAIALLQITMVLGLSGAGCNTDLTKYSGQYRGEVTSSRGNQRSQKTISVQVHANSSHELHVEGKTDRDVLSWELKTQPGLDQVHLKVNGAVPFKGMLFRKADTQCYKSSPLHLHEKATLCLLAEGASLALSNVNEDLTVSVTRPYQTSSAFPTLETPQSYSTVQLRDRAQKLSFDSRMAFEQLVNAKLNMKMHYLNLIPHLSIGSIVGIATFSGVPGLLTSIGDLAPFLLPSRWIQADESARLLDAQNFSTRIMQLDSMEIVEGMGYLVVRDDLLHTQLKSDRALISQIIQDVQTLEQSNKLYPGASLGLQAAGNALDQIISSLESQIGLEMTTVAQAAGFTNPNAISDVTGQPLGDILHPDTLDLPTLEGTALKGSLEVNQMDAIIAAAKIDRTGRGFQWMDPAGDSAGGFGVALPTYIQIGNSNVRELEISKDQLNSTLLKKVVDAYNDYLGWIDSYNLAKAGVQVDTQRIQEGRQNLASVEPSAADVSVQELRDAVEQLSANHANLITAEYAWYVAISRLDRLARQRAYNLASPT